MTIKQAIKNSSLEKHLIELILKEELDLSSSQLFLNQEEKISIFRAYRIKKIEQKARTGYPIQYIYKKAHFNGLDFFVNQNVLIPRPETEILVEKAKSLISKNGYNSVIDIGTGSGAIAITIAKANPNILVEAVDISKNALKIADRNAKKFGVKIKFYKGDLFSQSNRKYDLVLANLPYLNEKETNALICEPRLALFGGGNGMDLIENLLLDLPNFLAEDGTAIIEIGHEQKKAVQNACTLNKLKASFIKDLNGYDRFAIINTDRD